MFQTVDCNVAYLCYMRSTWCALSRIKTKLSFWFHECGHNPVRARVCNCGSYFQSSLVTAFSGKLDFVHDSKCPY